MVTNGRLVVVSNRVPDLRIPTTEEERRNVPVGGLVTALSSALEKRGGMWFGWSGVAVERGSAARTSTSAKGPIELVTMDLTRNEASLFYNDFCNRTLWPLLHGFPAKVSIRHDAYRAYVRANRRFAAELAPLLREGDQVWVNDFHLLLLGQELKRLGWTEKIGFFLHTPFPSADLFAVLPWAPQLTEALLDYDLVGVHTRRYLQNLMDTLSSELPGHIIGDVFICGQRQARLEVYPLGIDPDAFQQMAAESTGSATARLVKRVSQSQMTVLGVDRLDYTKGVGLRIRTFGNLLERYPGLRGKASMIQISAPSRTRVPEYIEERQQVDQLVGRINGRYSEADWIPIRYLYRSYPQRDLATFFRESDVCLLTPLRDGMNLVAKEYVASQGDNPGVLVLSRFCGAAVAMKEALIVNPYDIEGTADATYRALRMPRRERVQRWNALIRDVRVNTAQTWADSFLADLADS